MDWGFFSNSFNTDFKHWKIAFDDARSKKTLQYMLPLVPDCTWLVTAFIREPLQEFIHKLEFFLYFRPKSTTDCKE